MHYVHYLLVITMRLRMLGVLCEIQPSDVEIKCIFSQQNQISHRTPSFHKRTKIRKKTDIRDIAEEIGLSVSDKPDSQDICFVPNGNYSSVIEKFRPDSFKKGNIKNLEGEIVGVHDGIINFTIGQRRGIKVADKEPLYVIKIDSEKNEIIVGSKEKLGKKTISLKELNLLTNKEDLDQNLFVKVTSTGSLLDAKVDLIDNNNAKVNLALPEDGISPGQACVFYRKDQFGHKVLGGGCII